LVGKLRFAQEVMAIDNRADVYQTINTSTLCNKIHIIAGTDDRVINPNSGGQLTLAP
jgi:hypothetical protein